MFFLPISPWAKYGERNDLGVVRFQFLELLRCPGSGPKDWALIQKWWQTGGVGIYLKRAVVLSWHSKLWWLTDPCATDGPIA